MKGDFSRDTFDVTKHFSRVLLQQGRVQLDADWNEQTAILLHYLHTLAADIIGPFAGPAGDALGFGIKESAIQSKSWDFSIGKGRYYVDGILCENDEASLTYETQTDYPHPPALTNYTDYLVYLDIWERHISTLEDDYIREKALGGPDTASRAKIVWQVKVEDKIPAGRLLVEDDIKNPENWSQWIQGWQPMQRGSLRAKIKQPDKSADPCLTAPDAKYRGPENQLYRVEIHKGWDDVGPATFKWSRDNGSVVTGCTKSGKELTLNNPRGFTAPGWVELTNDGLELRGQPGVMAKVVKVDGDVLTLESDPIPPSGLLNSIDEVWPTKVRRWDHNETNKLTRGEDNRLFDADTGTLLIKEGASSEDPAWIELEHGIQIQFLPASDGKHRYRTGDYWLIPARVATGDIEWPLELDAYDIPQPAPQPPRGILHHYAPLAILKANQGDWVFTDLRCEFHPLSDTCGLSYSYGKEGIGGHPLSNPPMKKK